MNATTRKKWPQGWGGLLLCALGTALFLAVVWLVVYHGAAPWMPAGPNNDEVVYNRQVVGVLAGGGQPRGVFGYNEGRAAVGHFGGWGPLLIWLYALPGLLVGSGVNTMFWCNLIFAAAGWLVFVRGTRLGWKAQLLFGAAVLCCWFPVQQVFSGSGEPLQFFLILAAVGAFAALRRSFRWGWFVLLAACCALTTMTRAYTVLLWGLPIALYWRSRRPLALACGAGAVLSLAGYGVITAWMTAAFFSENIDTRAFSLLLGGQVVQAVVYAFTRLGEQLAYLWTEGIAPMLGGDFRELGLTALLVVFLLVVTAGTLVWDRRYRRPVLLKACALVIVGISLVGLLELYAMYAMTRHFIMLAVLLLAALACENPRAMAWCLVGVVLLPYQLGRAALPAYNADQAAQMTQLETALTQREAAQTSDDPWAHTLSYAFRDDVFHGYLYAVPAGMGIQFDQNTYLADAANPIHAQYVMVGHGSAAEARLLAEGWQELVSTRDLVVYERPQTDA